MTGSGEAPAAPVARWLVLPGLACPASSFDAVRSELRRLQSPVHLDVLDAWAEAFLESAPQTVLAGRSYDGVVGHSLGGLLAVQMVLAASRDDPSSTGRLVLLDPTTPSELGPGPAGRRVLERVVPVAVRWAGAVGLVRAVGWLANRWWRLSPASGDPSFASTATWQRLWRETVAGWDRARQVGTELSSASVDVPVTHLVAGRARRAERTAQAAFALRLGTRAVPVPGSGHLVMRDRPDIVAAAIARPPGPAGVDHGWTSPRWWSPTGRAITGRRGRRPRGAPGRARRR